MNSLAMQLSRRAVLSRCAPKPLCSPFFYGSRGLSGSGSPLDAVQGSSAKPKPAKKAEIEHARLPGRHANDGRGGMGKFLFILGGAAAGTAYAIENGHTKYQNGVWEAYADLVDNVAMPAVRMFDPETAHNIAVMTTAWGLGPRDWFGNPPALNVDFCGLKFANPLGMSAGFDKHGEAVDGLLATGFGHVEVGSVTPLPQEGNPKPRLFRLHEDGGVVNRYGFNSQGVAKVEARLKARRTAAGAVGVVGVNVGKNKDSASAEEDYCAGIRALGPHADYLVVNVSCPNQAGVAALQDKGSLASIVDAALAARNELPAPRPPLLVKIGPDLDAAGRAAVARTCLAKGVDGLVVTNTTTARPASLRSPDAGEAGGLSGAPLRAAATKTVRDLYRLTRGRLPIVGSGGVGSAEDVLEKIEAGASLVQIYSSLVYSGPGAIPKMKRDLLRLMKERGYSSITEAVGAKNPLPKAAAGGKCPVDHGSMTKKNDESGGAAEKKKRWWLLWLM